MTKNPKKALKLKAFAKTFLKTKSRFNRIGLVVFTVLFGGLGYYLLFSSRAATTSIVDYISTPNKPGGQVVEIPCGTTLKGGGIANVSRADWLVLKAPIPGCVTVDLSTSNLTLGPSTNRVLFMGLKFINGTFIIQGDDIAFWYTEHTFSPEEWGRQFQANGGVYGDEGKSIQAILKMHNPIPKGLWVGQGANRTVSRISVLGSDLHDIADDGLFFGGTQDDVVAGTRIWNIDEKQYDPNFNPWRANSDLWHNDSIQTPGGVNNLNVSYSSFGQMLDLAGDNGNSTNLNFSDIWITASPSVGFNNYVQHGWKLTGSMKNVRGWGNGRQHPGNPGYDNIRSDFNGKICPLPENPKNACQALWPDNFNGPELNMADLGGNLNRVPPPGLTITGDRQGDQAIALEDSRNPAKIWRAAHPYDTACSYLNISCGGSTNPNWPNGQAQDTNICAGKPLQDLTPYITAAGGQEKVVPDGCYKAGSFTAPHDKWLILKAQTPGKVIVDGQFVNAFKLNAGTSYITFVGFQFVNVMVSVNAHHINFWYSDFQDWDRNYKSRQPIVTPRLFSVEAGTNNLGVYGSDFHHRVATASYMLSNVSDVTWQGMKIYDGDNSFNDNDNHMESGPAGVFGGLTRIKVLDSYLEGSYINYSAPSKLGGSNTDLRFDNIWYGFGQYWEFLMDADCGKVHKNVTRNNWQIFNRVDETGKVWNNVGDDAHGYWTPLSECNKPENQRAFQNFSQAQMLNHPEIFGYTESNINYSVPAGVTDQASARAAAANPANLWRTQFPYNSYRTTLGLDGVTPTPPPPALSDLVLTSLTATPANPKTGDKVTFSATIKNASTTTATPNGIERDLSFRIDGTEVTWSIDFGGSLGPGQSVTLSTDSGATAGPWTAVQGPHTLEAYVDNLERIAESDENNNKLSISITVASMLPPAQPPKRGDFDRDNKIDSRDLDFLIRKWRRPASALEGDLSGDGQITLLDLSMLLKEWGR